jgi:UDP-N-acetylglucosamine 2-epimerase
MAGPYGGISGHRLDFGRPLCVRRSDREAPRTGSRQASGAVYAALNDAGGRSIIATLAELEKKRLPNVQFHTSLGRSMYHGVLALAWDRKVRVACVGNSSSGIKETPVFGCPTVNIGSRQEGRLRGCNVIDAGYCAEAIVSSVERCLHDEAFRATAHATDNPYYLGGAGKKIADVLAEVPIGQKLLRKSMTLTGEVRSGWYR